MLIDFTVENFRSIKEPVTLSAGAQKSKVVPSGKDTTRFIVPDDEIAPPFAVEGWNFELLPALAIFGANASGKSNVISALGLLLDYMVIEAEHHAAHWQKFVPFMLETPTQIEPVRLELRAVIQETFYTYTLHVGRERILLERLYSAHVSTKRDHLLYQRTWNKDSQRYDWKNGRIFVGSHTQVEVSLHEQITFMSMLTRLDVGITDAFKSWLKNHSYGFRYGYDLFDERDAAERTYTNPAYLSKTSAILRAFDTGIDRLEVSHKSHEINPFPYEVFAWHKTKEDEVKFRLFEESTGTRRLFVLASILTKAFDTGGVVLADELETSIHPHIAAQMVTLFQSSKTNPKRAQLIFTSHDNTLQRNHLLRRDQIWFTQKRLDGSTELYPLSDFKPRNDAAIDRSYFDGRFGAVPFIDADEEGFAKILAGAA